MSEATVGQIQELLLAEIKTLEGPHQTVQANQDSAKELADREGALIVQLGKVTAELVVVRGELTRIAGSHAGAMKEVEDSRDRVARIGERSALLQQAVGMLSAAKEGGDQQKAALEAMDRGLEDQGAALASVEEGLTTQASTMAQLGDSFEQSGHYIGQGVKAMERWIEVAAGA